MEAHPFPLRSSLTGRESIGQRSRRLRLELGLTMDQLARMSNCSKTTVYSLEKGDVSRPQTETLVRLARSLGVTAEYLLTGIDYVPISDPSVLQWPPLEITLERTTNLTRQQIESVVIMIRALESQALKEREIVRGIHRQSHRYQ